jgi:hypothetical protein
MYERKTLGFLAVLLLLVSCNMSRGTVGELGTQTSDPTALASHPVPTSTEEQTSIISTVPSAVLAPPIWGRLANPGFENQRIKTSLFFSGQARDGNASYGCRLDGNLDLYTVHPLDDRHLQWSERNANRELVIEMMVEAGLNVINMSSWGEDDLPCDVGWSKIAPMQSAPQSHDELFSVAVDSRLLIIPFIESRDDWALRNEFPRDVHGDIAPGAVSQIVNLIQRYLQNSEHPEWARQWAQVYNHRGEPRYAITFIHASSNRLGPTQHAKFAEGFDALAEAVFLETGVHVGFLIDPLPPGSNAPGSFRPTAEGSGPYLLDSEAILAIQAFIPEIWISGWPSEAQMITWKNDFSRRWSETGIPFLMDISPGYDARVVFPNSIRYGFSESWQQAGSSLVEAFAEDGMVFNSWNGYTEGMAAVPTVEYGVQYFRWLQELTAWVDSLKD